MQTGLLCNPPQGREHATDVTNASRTLLLNLRTGDWDPAMLKLLRIPRAVLPEVRSCSEVYGEVTSIPELRGVPVAGIAGDQQAALFGQACFRSGMAKNTYGTGCFLLLHTGSRPILSHHGLLTTVALRLGPAGKLEYALEGSVFIGGAVVQWLRDKLGIIRKSADVMPLAASVEDSDGVFFVPAFAGLGAPHWDPDARGLIAGLTRGSTAAHIARAAVDSIAYQSADLLAAMESDSRSRLRELCVDGGASANDALMQFQCDLLRVTVVRPRTLETTALGAAYLAGLATGVWKDRSEIESLWKAGRRFRPRAKAAKVRRLQEAWREAVGRTRTP